MPITHLARMFIPATRTATRGIATATHGVAQSTRFFSSIARPATSFRFTGNFSLRPSVSTTINPHAFIESRPYSTTLTLEESSILKKHKALLGKIAELNYVVTTLTEKLAKQDTFLAHLIRRLHNELKRLPQNIELFTRSVPLASRNRVLSSYEQKLSFINQYLIILINMLPDTLQQEVPTYLLQTTTSSVTESQAADELLKQILTVLTNIAHICSKFKYPNTNVMIDDWQTTFNNLLDFAGAVCETSSNSNKKDRANSFEIQKNILEYYIKDIELKSIPLSQSRFDNLFDDPWKGLLYITLPIALAIGIVISLLTIMMIQYINSQKESNPIDPNPKLNHRP